MESTATIAEIGKAYKKKSKWTGTSLHLLQAHVSQALFYSGSDRLRAGTFSKNILIRFMLARIKTPASRVLTNDFLDLA